MARTLARDWLPEDVEQFLNEFKTLLRYHPLKVSWIGRHDRQAELADLGLTMNLAKDIIRDHLKPEHWQRGPEPDDGAPDTGTICIFRCPVPGHPDAYVKIGLRVVARGTGGLRGVIWSFKRWSTESGVGT